MSLLQPLPLPPRDSYKGALSQEEMELLEEASRKKTLALALLRERDQELEMIRDGQLTSSKVGQCVVIM